MSVPASVLLATSFPPTTGGMETLLYQANRRLQVPPVVVAPPPSYVPDMRVWPVRMPAPSAVNRLGYRASWQIHPSLHYLRTFWQPALRAIRATRPRVLQCGHVYLAPLTWLAARRFNLPWVQYAYAQEVWRGGRKMGLAQVDRILRGRALANADRLISLGEFTTSLLLEWGVSPDRIAVLPFGADPRPGARPPSGARLLSVSRLVPRKGVDTVIRAMPRVAAQIPDVEYRVVGGGPDEQRLRALAREMRVADRVQFLGRIDDDALADEYQACALFTLPARRTLEGEVEGLGLVYLEAAAWGRAVLAGSSGGERDAVQDGVTGCLVDGNNVAQVADAIVNLLRQPESLRRMGEAGRKRVETTHNWARTAASLAAVLSDVAAQRS